MDSGFVGLNFKGFRGKGPCPFFDRVGDRDSGGDYQFCGSMGSQAQFAPRLLLHRLDQLENAAETIVRQNMSSRVIRFK